MRDPYEVLGLSSTATNEEVKKRFRHLAKKYHPDNYRGTPLDDIAQEKMKAISEAYEAIQAERIPQGFFQSSGNDNLYTGQSEAGFSTFSNDLFFQRVRSAIGQNNLKLAEQLLSDERNHNAEWFYLKGYISYQNGWMDEALVNYKQAVQLDPDNNEYRFALKNLAENKDAYRPDDYRAASTAEYSEASRKEAFSKWCRTAGDTTCGLCRSAWSCFDETCGRTNRYSICWND